MKVDEQKKQTLSSQSKCEELKNEYKELCRRYSNAEIQINDSLSGHEQRSNDLISSQRMNAENQSSDSSLNGYQQRNNNDLISSRRMYEILLLKKQLDDARREASEAKSYLMKVQQQRDEALNKVKETVSLRIKATRDLARLTKERNDAVKEYNLIMSERNSVHEDIKNLQIECSESKSRLKCLEKENRELFAENQCLKKQKIKLLLKNEQITKDCNFLRFRLNSLRGGEKYSTASTSSSASLSQASSSASEFDANDSKNESEMKFAFQHRKIEALQSEIYFLKKSLERAKEELITAKTKHEQNLSEKLTAVLEKASVETLSNQYRKERDSALLRLADALTDLNDLKIENNALLNKLNDYKCMYETTSVDSSTLSPAKNKNENILSSKEEEKDKFSLSSSLLQEPYSSEEDNVSKSENTSNVDYSKSNLIEKTITEPISPPSSNVREVHIRRRKQPLGLSLVTIESCGVFVSKVESNSLADKAGIQQYDRVLEVCGINLRNSNSKLAYRILNQCLDDVYLVLQYSPQIISMKTATLV
ncbi:disks large 5-like protein [Dinothrombium tinctorium]|uniref:Disks large 5-like protein n=1 Tax=Dinothrombium tinctorium TaxID=1965070 RepID=A0A443QS44_9ACAR|nr:disks large 5-like protein [Dinothrombium tinctorium]